jgi:hypothetical protein
MRLADAQVLFSNRRYAAAYYLAGYAVECGLKACIAKQFKLYEFPPPNTSNTLYIHRLADLATHDKLAGLLDFQKQSVPGFESNWTVVAGWTERSRYKHDWSREQAEKLIAAITQETAGVMEWIRQLW